MRLDQRQALVYHRDVCHADALWPCVKRSHIVFMRRHWAGFQIVALCAEVPYVRIKDASRNALICAAPQNPPAFLALSLFKIRLGRDYTLSLARPKLQVLLAMRGSSRLRNATGRESCRAWRLETLRQTESWKWADEKRTAGGRVEHGVKSNSSNEYIKLIKLTIQVHGEHLDTLVLFLRW